jgi:transcriptional regulator with XRE-family HTH domain
MKADSPVSLGSVIRSLRTRRNQRLSDLAERVGVSISYLSQVERDKIAPSISSLTRIAEGLDTTVPQLFDAMAARKRVAVVRHGQRKVLAYPGSTAQNEMLTPDLSGSLQVIWSALDPGKKSPVLQHPGEECGVVLRGALTVWVGEEKFVLQEGDSITFKGDCPHRYENHGNTRVEAIWCITPPSY